MGEKGRLLIYAPVPVFLHGDKTYVEDQAIIGLNRWADNFDHVDVMMPARQETPEIGWSEPIGENSLPDNLTLHVLPTAYRPDQFAKHYASTRRRIEELIDKNDYLSFSIGGLFGDWGAVSGFAAKSKGRPFAVWADRVESEIVRLGRKEGSWKRRLKSHLYHRPMALLEHAVIRRADLGLFHGMETFNAYSGYSPEAKVVHDILLDQKDHIPTKMLRKKILKVGTGPLKIVYAGRADPMKGPLDWVEVLEKLDARGVDFHATWLGDGPLLDAMKAKIKAAGLGGKVTMPGFVSDRQYVLDVLRDAHIHMFCHKTPESPRNLIEALISGTPIVGYDGAYARDLVHGHRGGEFVSIGETDALADQVEAIANDRANLAQLMEDAYNDGKIFSSDAVFKHRSDLIKEFLPGPAKEMAPLHA